MTSGVRRNRVFTRPSSAPNGWLCLTVLSLLSSACGDECPDGWQSSAMKCRRAIPSTAGTSGGAGGADASQRADGDEAQDAGEPVGAHETSERAGSGGAPAAHGGSGGALSKLHGGASAPQPPIAAMRTPIVAGPASALLFWGDAVVAYPFTGDALLQTDPLTNTKYWVTGKVTLANTSSSVLDVSCSLRLDTMSDVEHVSVPAASNGVVSRLPVFTAFVGANAGSAAEQRARLTCTCASAISCNALSFENLGIVVKAVAADSGNMQVVAPSAP
jgi:hypothetical protein